MIRSVNLHKKIKIQQATESRTDSVSVENTWSTIAEPWASVEPVSGREYFAAQQVQAENTIKFRIRYQSGLDPKMRILYNDNVYDIKSIINASERNDELLIMGTLYVD